MSLIFLGALFVAALLALLRWLPLTAPEQYYGLVARPQQCAPTVHSALVRLERVVIDLQLGKSLLRGCLGPWGVRLVGGKKIRKLLSKIVTVLGNVQHWQRFVGQQCLDSTLERAFSVDSHDEAVSLLVNTVATVVQLSLGEHVDAVGSAYEAMSRRFAQADAKYKVRSKVLWQWAAYNLCSIVPRALQGGEVRRKVVEVHTLKVMLNVLLDDASDVILDKDLCRALFKVSTPLAVLGEERLSKALDPKFDDYYSVTSQCRRTADDLLDSLEAEVAQGPSLHELAVGSPMQRRDSGGRTHGQFFGASDDVQSEMEAHARQVTQEWLQQRGGEPDPHTVGQVLDTARFLRAQRETSFMRAPESMYLSLQINGGAATTVFNLAKLMADLDEVQAEEYAQTVPVSREDPNMRRIAVAFADALRFLPTLSYMDEDEELGHSMPPYFRLLGLVLADNMNMREFHQTHLELLFLQQPVQFATDWQEHWEAAEEVMVLRQFMGQVANGLGTGATELEQSDRGNMMFYLCRKTETPQDAVTSINSLFDRKTALTSMLADVQAQAQVEGEGGEGRSEGGSSSATATLLESIAKVDEALLARLPHAQRMSWKAWTMGKERLRELEARLPEALRSSLPGPFHQEVGFDADYIALYQYVVFKGDLAAGSS